MSRRGRFLDGRDRYSRRAPTPTPTPGVSRTHMTSQRINFAYGGSPMSTTGGPFTITNGAKVVVHLDCKFGAGGGQTISTVKANSNALTFTLIGSSAAGQERTFAYYLDTSGITSITEITVDPGGNSTQEVAIHAVQIVGAAAGAPASNNIVITSITNPDPIDVDGGIASTVNGVQLCMVGGAESSTYTFTGATALAATVVGDASASRIAAKTGPGSIEMPGQGSSGPSYVALRTSNTVWEP